MIYALAPLLVLLQPAGAAVPPNPNWNCDDPVVQQEMNWCAAQDYKAADDQLNAQWSQTREEMRRQDKSWKQYGARGRDDRPGWSTSLLEAQRAWLKFRDAHCRIEGYGARGGSLEPFLVSRCKQALTEERTKQLKALAQSPE